MSIVHVYTGNGGGKTTAALGVSMRALGHGKKVLFIQFMKGRKTGELLAARTMKNFEIKQFGSKEFVNLENPSKKDRELANKGLDFARKALKDPPYLLVLDELNLAVSCGLIDVKEAIGLLDSAPKSLNIILTGRNAPKELLERADFVTELSDLKSPAKPYAARKGIEY